MVEEKVDGERRLSFFTVSGNDRPNLDDPLAIYLFPSEQVVYSKVYRVIQSEKLPDATQQLILLAGVDKEVDIGLRGPVQSARVTEGNGNIEALKLFETVHGRDSLRTALDVYPKYPLLLESTVMYHLSLLGVENNIAAEEEPGRAFHEVRQPGDPLRDSLESERGWAFPYYGTVDATPTLIQAIALIAKSSPAFLSKEYQAKDGKKLQVIDGMERALGWLGQRLSLNKEGLLGFWPTNNAGSIENQSWRDSSDGYFDADGQLVHARSGREIYDIGVQALAYDALIDSIAVHERLQKIGSLLINKIRHTNADLQVLADNLKSQVLDLFWNKEGGFFVFGAMRGDDGELHQLKVKTSEAGHLLNSRLFESTEPDIVTKQEKLIKMLFDDDMLANTGIRAVGLNEPAFRPHAYHYQVWPWETLYIAEGLRRYGYFGLAKELGDRVIGTCDQLRIYPECVRSGTSQVPQINTMVVDVRTEGGATYRIAQPPQEIQAWTVTGYLKEKQAQDTVPSEAVDPKLHTFEQEILRKINIPDNLERIV